MNPNFRHLMNEAARLTRAGDLQAATAAIQSALGGSLSPPGVAGPASRTRGPDGDGIVIDVDAREVSDRRSPDPAPAAGVTGPPPSRGIDEARGTAMPAPDGGDRFVAGSYGAAAGRRDYKLYIPPAADGPRPLIVMLHGCTQDPDDFAAGTAMNDIARREGWFVLYPAQSAKANPQRCWNWFKHNHQRRDRGEPALIVGMTRDVMRQHPIDADRVYVAGLSAGGAMAAILAGAYPELFAAVGVHSGLAAGVASDLPSALSAMKGGARAPVRTGGAAVPTIVFHGDADATVHAANGEQVIAAGIGAGNVIEVERRADAGGRACTRRLHRAPDGRVVAEHWIVHGGSHAWSGGNARGSYADPRGPDASAEMMRFFGEQRRGPAAS